MLEMIGRGKVIGIDIKIHAENRKAIEKHPMFKRIILIENSSISKEAIKRVGKLSKNKKCVMVILDSNHTHKHVFAELEAYADLTSINSFCVVFDTIVEEMDDKFFKNRPWGKGNNPKTSVKTFLKNNKKFKVNKEIENKLLITAAPCGFLECIED